MALYFFTFTVLLGLSAAIPPSAPPSNPPAIGQATQRQEMLNEAWRDIGRRVGMPPVPNRPNRQSNTRALLQDMSRDLMQDRRLRTIPLPNSQTSGR
jgi:hypothetical protein